MFTDNLDQLSVALTSQDVLEPTDDAADVL